MARLSDSELNEIISTYKVGRKGLVIRELGEGLINSTWRLTNDDEDYILQKINDEVFKSPEDIAHNVRLIADYLKLHNPDLLLTEPLRTNEDNDLLYLPNYGYYRLTYFVKDSHSICSADNPNQAYEASKKFGEFTKVLSELPIDKLKITIPDFHNLSLRYDQFKFALHNGNKLRIQSSKDAIDYILDKVDIVEVYENILQNEHFKLRVTHHDTKISNVLFDDADKGLCVIDLDTIMPGYFISDVGDMIRTYVSASTEEEKDLTKISIRDEFFIALWKGYMSEMKDKLSREEKDHFIYAGKYLIYMQAIRFLTDYLNNDIYYGSAYTDQNLYRAKNQIKLLDCLIAKEEKLKMMISQNLF